MGDRVPGLLRLRVTPPAVPAGYLHRPRLADMLSAGAAGPVTLVSAGPGSGKTLTMAAWARGPLIPGAVAWLAVDDSDNDLQTFWSDVLGALTVGAAVPADSALRQMMPAAGFGAREVAAVRAGLAELQGAVVLVLDDFHHVTDRAVLDSFDQLLDHQPPQLHLILAARADPALRLHRLRVNGQVTDVRARDLAFTAREAAELFSGTGLRLSDRHLAVLLDRSRGWAAGLRLALMCLDPADIDGGLARFTGSNHLVAEYLIEQVIDQLTDPDREFLLTTSVADRLTAGLVNAITGRDDGQSTLERLTEHNALLVDLTGRSEWFGVHPLLRDLLSHRLSRDQPGAVTELHLQAARWFTGRNDPIPAIRHAGLAGQWDDVGRVLTTLGLPLLLTSRSPSLVAALAPAAARARLQPTASTLLAAAVCDYHRHDFDSMARDAGAAADLTDGVPAGDRAAAAALTLLLQLVHARTGDLAAVTPIAARLLHLLDRTPLPQLPTAEHYRVIATNNIALGQLWTGDLAAAATNLSAVQTRCTDLGLGFLELSAQAHLALLDAIRGELPDAAHRAGRWRRIAESRGWAGEPHALALYAALALTDIDRNRLDAAAAAIDAGLAVSNGGSDIACRLVLAIAAVQLALARRDPAAARAAAARLDGLQTQAGALPPMLHLWCAVAHADTHLAAGHPQAAIDVLTGDNPEPAGFAAALRRVTLAKARLLLHQPGAALDLLDEDPAALRPYRGPAVEGRVLAAVAADRTHRDTAALDAITDAIDLAHGIGMTRPFLAAQPQIAPLITRHRHVITRHLDFTGELTPHHPGTAEAAPTVDPLTERERAVLSYLPTMFKATEIASDLFITINTVKTHQQSIYRKLGVTTRRDAVTRARDLHLL